MKRITIKSVILCSVVLVVLSGCASFGHRNIARDRFNYNEAIAQSRNQQMLLNIIRLRYIEMPDFLAVSSIITSYSYDSSLGLSGTVINNPSAEIFTGNANLKYTEKPTITYAPLAGQEFAQRLLKPISVDGIFALGQAGWPMDLLMAIGLQRINNIKNMGFGSIPAPGEVDQERQFRNEASNLNQFSRVLRLIVMLAEKGVLEVQRKNNGQEEYSQLTFSNTQDPAAQQLVEEFKSSLQLDAKLNSFHITSRTTERGPDEITIQSRSLLSMMAFLARGVMVPEEDELAGKVVVFPEEVQKAIAAHGALKIHSQEKIPVDPYLAVQYRNTWFYIDNTDITSKRTFSTLQIIFQLQAPTKGAAAPLLTLPAG